jgi:hypothetical protein
MTSDKPGKRRRSTESLCTSFTSYGSGPPSRYTGEPIHLDQSRLPGSERPRLAAQQLPESAHQPIGQPGEIITGY